MPNLRLARVLSSSLLGAALVAALACSGVDAPAPEPSPPQPADPDASVEPDAAPAATEDLSSVVTITAKDPSWPASPRVFSLEPVEGTCVWKVSGADGNSVAFAETDGCPEQVVWSDAELVAWFREYTLVHSWKAGKTERVPTETPPTVPCDSPFPAKNGELRRVCTVYTAEWELDGETYPVGETEDGSTGYGLQGRKVVPPRNDGKDVFLPNIGSRAFAVVEFYKKGAWSRAFALPTMVDSEFGPGTSVVEPFLGSAAVVSTGALQECCFCGGQDCAFDDQPEKSRKLGFDPEESIGSLPVGDGRAWFPVVYGDTPHASAPVVWCATPECSEPVAWEGVDGTVGIAPRGKFALVGTEYSGAGARVFEAGRATPVLSFPEATTVVWLPDGGLPPL